MVAEAISADRGVWLANEPYAVLPAHPAFDLKRSRLPERAHSQFFALDEAEEAMFAAYTGDLLAARLPALGACRRHKPLLRADRVCLKILNAPWMIDWFESATDAHVVPLLRHPGAQAASALRQDWGFSLEAYADRLDGDWHDLSDAQARLVRDAVRDGDRWRIAILDYLVTTRPMARRAGAGLVLYEDVVADPGRFVDEVLVGRLGIEDRAAALGSLSRPSGSSGLSRDDTRAAIEGRDLDRVLNGWRRSVTPEMSRTAQGLLDAFGFDLYRFD